MYCSVLIIMKTMYVLVSMPHLRRCSPHVNRLYGDVNIYIAGINVASQEVFSTTRGVRINPVIKRYCVCYNNPKPLHVTHLIDVINSVASV